MADEFTIILTDLKKKLDDAQSAFDKRLKGLRTGRASPSILDHITAEIYGSEMPLSQLATVNAPDPKMITVQVWDKSSVGPIEKAIRTAGLGLNPVPEGQMIRIPVPTPSEERRKELSKVASQYAEESKTGMRNIRRDMTDLVKKKEKEGGISEDQVKDTNKKIQDMLDVSVKKIEETLASKIKEILHI